MILTIDIGNSRIKWALWQDDAIIERAALHYTVDKCEHAFDELFSCAQLASTKPLLHAVLGGDRLSQVFALCVAGDYVRRALSEWIKQHWQQDVEYLKTARQYKNIVNAYPYPEQHGVDRWAGIVAAQHCYPDSSLCVIGAGTALTFDLIKKHGQHLGGYILPSYATMRKSLMTNTAQVISDETSDVDLQYKKQAVPDNTGDAVNQGLHILLQAGIRELCQHAQTELDVPMKIVISGGFAPTILSYPDMPAMQYQPDLVMQGLYNIMKQKKISLES